MNCDCISHEKQTGRNKFSSETPSPSRRKAPLMMKIAHTLGIKDYLINKFVFRKKASKYQILQGEDGEYSYIQEKLQFTKQFDGYSTTIDIIQEEGLSIPVIKFTSKKNRKGLTIVYSHGNSSDLSDSLKFMFQFMKYNSYNVIVYDYSGYGVSRIQNANQQTICRDLDAVLRWANLPHRQIVLWGFSLGSFPTIDAASKRNFGGVVLHSPIASIATLLDSQNRQNMQECQYDLDFLNNLEKMHEIASPIVIFHSSQDELIPFSHAQKLYAKLKTVRSDNEYSLVEISDLSHNQMHFYFAEKKANALNALLIKFLERARKNSIAIDNLWNLQTECEEEFTVKSHNIVSSNSHNSYFRMLE